MSQPALKLNIAEGASDADLRLLVSAISDYAIFMLDLRGRVSSWNAGAEALKGYAAAEVIGRSFATFYTAEDREAGVPEQMLALALQHGHCEQEGWRLRKDGTRFWADVRVTPVRDGRGALIGFAKVTRDLSERRRGDEELQRAHEQLEERVRERTSELQRAEEKYRRIVETTNEGVLVVDAGGIATFANPRLEQMLGYGKGEIVGQQWMALLDERERGGGMQRIRERRAGVAAQVELRLRRADGSPLWVAASATPVMEAGGNYQGTVSMLTDITERRRGDEAALRLAAIVESSADAILSIDEQGRCTSWNDAAERLFGFTAAELLGRELTHLFPPERKGEREELLARLRRGEMRVQLETQRLHKDGTAIDVMITVAAITVASGRRELCLIARDLTEQKRAEKALRETEEQLRQSQKMDAVGRLAGGVAHDFNNLLSVILGYGGAMLEELAPDQPARRDLEEVLKAGRRASELTQQLLLFGRQQVTAMRDLDLNQLVADAERMIRRIVGEDVELLVVRGEPLGCVRGDPGNLEQVLMNLVVNARDAMPHGGRLTLQTANVALDDEQARHQPGTRPGAHVMVSVSDTGVGIDRETRPRIFEPFFTTKERGKGTGLGLSTVFGIVQRHGGGIAVESEPGHGSTFRIYLPAVPAQDVAPAATPVSPVLRGSETVLLVEDEEQVRAVAQRILERQGYRVVAARDGAEALRACASLETPIQLVLSDVVMPGMSGAELVQRLAAVLPGAKVLFVSGYADDSLIRSGVLEREVAFLAKPFAPETLARKVREVLDAASDRYTAQAVGRIARELRR